MKNTVELPDHLKGYTVLVDKIEGFSFKTWFETLTWRGKLQIDKDDLFKLVYCGEKCEDGFLKNKGDAPLVIFAESIKKHQ